jgi:hypothetical protein
MQKLHKIPPEVIVHLTAVTQSAVMAPAPAMAQDAAMQ